MSVYSKVKATNLKTQQVMGYLGFEGKCFCPLVGEGSAGVLTWAEKGGEIFLALKNPAWDLAGEQLWLLRDSADNEWARWSWTSSYTAVRWNADHTLSVANEPHIKLFVDRCEQTGGRLFFRWGPDNPSVVQLDFIN